jgi:hypothetical protein
MQKIKLFANYSIPVVWLVVGLIIDCVAVYYPLSIVWERVIVTPETVTPTDGLTVIILSVIADVFVGSAALFGSAQHRWTARHESLNFTTAATCLDTPRSLPVN